MVIEELCSPEVTAGQNFHFQWKSFFNHTSLLHDFEKGTFYNLRCQSNTDWPIWISQQQMTNICETIKQKKYFSHLNFWINIDKMRKRKKCFKSFDWMSLPEKLYFLFSKRKNFNTVNLSPFSWAALQTFDWINN